MNTSDVPISQFDIQNIINNLVDDDDEFPIYLISEDNKKSLTSLIYKHTKKSPYNKDLFLIFYNLGGYAHWCAMVINYQTKTAYFYCSFGIFIDGQYAFANSHIDDHSLVKTILKKLFKIGYEVHYNNQQIQGTISNACGRYCALFLALNLIDDVNPDKFNSIILNDSQRYQLSPDEYIINITNDLF